MTKWLTNRESSTVVAWFVSIDGCCVAVGELFVVVSVERLTLLSPPTALPPLRLRMPGLTGL